MDFDHGEMDDLMRKTNDLTSETADIARLLKVRLGAGHHLSRRADEMFVSMEALARELRSFCASTDGDRSELFEQT
jgi:hypothetical protein